MKNISQFLILVIFFAVIFWTQGCGIHGQGETAAEGHRRHKRVLENDIRQVADDLDAVFMLDRPSRLGELRIR